MISFTCGPQNKTKQNKRNNDNNKKPKVIDTDLRMVVTTRGEGRRGGE